jgi:ribose-phosphate pyrophosphokinase
MERLRGAVIDQIAITDSIPIPSEKMLPNMKIISVATLIAKAIHRIHGNESISALFDDGPGGELK